MPLLPDPAVRDIRTKAAFERVAQFYEQWHGPAFNTISAGTTPTASPDGRSIAFAGEVRAALEGRARFRLAEADEAGVRTLTDPTLDVDERCPRYSPDGGTIAFTSDRRNAGIQQLALYDVTSGQLRETPPIDGIVEQLRWSPDGTRILLGVAGLGAELSAGQGSGDAVRGGGGELPAWIPKLNSGITGDHWRSIWIYDVAADTVERRELPELNVWESDWSGPDAVIAVVSPSPDEAAWYTAELHRIDLSTGRNEVVHTSDRQLGWPAASPAGRRCAVVQACSSDRWLIAGDVVIVDAEGAPAKIDTLGTDVTHLQWLGETRLAFIGLRGLHTVAGVHDTASGETVETWSSTTSCGDIYPVASFLPDGSAAIVHSAYTVYQELAWLRDGHVHPVASLRHPGADTVSGVSGSTEPIEWTAPDGTAIQGLLSTPDGDGPFPLVVNVHGGPVWSYRNLWSLGGSYSRLLVSRGYAVLHPNPRGSSGRGQAFAEAVFGDPGGADMHDLLSGIDALVTRGTVDPDRVGVTGGSYGGYMSAWLITQDRRFAAAAPMFPVTDWYSQHLTSNISFFDELLLADDPKSAAGAYSMRSPVRFAHQADTPTLQSAGVEDRCTPPGQAEEFHAALLGAGVPSICLIYPGEGHGLRAYPAIIDQGTRIVDWFERYMPASDIRERLTFPAANATETELVS